PSAAVPLDEHRRVRGGDLADDLLHALHRRRVADHLVDGELLAQARAERLHLALEEATLGDPRHQVAQLVQDQRLREVVVGAFLEGLDGGGDRGVSRHHDDLDGIVVALDLAEKVEPAHLGHPNIGDRRIEELGPDRFESLASGADAHHLVAPLSEGFLQELEDRGLVIDYEDLCDFHDYSSTLARQRCKNDKLYPGFPDAFPCAGWSAMLA